MHLADASIQSDLQCIQAIHFLSVRRPTNFSKLKYKNLNTESTSQKDWIQKDSKLNILS